MYSFYKSPYYSDIATLAIQVQRFVVDFTLCPWACGGEDCLRLGFTTSLRFTRWNFRSHNSRRMLSIVWPRLPPCRIACAFWVRTGRRNCLLLATASLLHNFCTQEPSPRNIICILPTGAVQCSVALSWTRFLRFSTGKLSSPSIIFGVLLKKVFVCLESGKDF